MALTNEEKQELLNAMKAESQSVDNLEVVTSLDGVKSLPAVRGEELVSAPLSLLGKPAQDAAAIANSAAATAYEAAGKANDAAEKAETFGEQAEKAAATATEAVGKANEAISAANTVAANYEHSAKLGLDGATARFAGIDETTGITTELSSLIATALDVVVWSVEKKTFLLRSKDKKYYTSWAADGGRSMALFLDGQTVKQDKVYACGESLYVYSDGDLVEISGSGGGNIYNVTSEAPLSDGYYTLQTAIAAVEAKQRRKGLCVTYETAQGKWETKQFVGTSLDSWEQATAWADFGGDGTVKSVTWAEIKQLRDAGHLDDGTLYRITDYETTVANDPEARSAGHPFDLVVMALDAGTLSERAWAMRSARDTAGYFAGAKLESWQVWYCLDNDTTRFQWADTATGKGVIYRLIDEWGNDCPYDFKNVQFKRCLTSGDFVDNVVDDADWPNTHYILSPSMNGQADMTADETDYKWLYTFTYLEQMQDVRDASLINEVNADFESAYYNKACNCNEMQAYYIGEFIDDTTFATQALNNIVLSSYDEENGAAVKMYGNKWGAGCFNMTFHEHCYGNSFGVNCYCLIGFKLYYNTFGNECYNNTFGNSCVGNTFGNSCNGNTFGNSCVGNTFGNSCGGNTFGNSCVGNTFGNYLQYITAGEGVKYLNVTGGSDVKHFVQNAHILNGTSGKDSKNLLTVGLPEMSTVCRYVGQNTAGVLKIWVPADLV